MTNTLSSTPRREQPFTVGQRVTLHYWGKPRAGTVMEIHPMTGFVRVEIDRATMHEWTQPEALAPIESERFNLLDREDDPAETLDDSAQAEIGLGLGDIVRLPNGVEAVVCNRASNDRQRWRVAWFNRRLWQVEKKWYDRDCLVLLVKGALNLSAGAKSNAR